MEEDTNMTQATPVEAPPSPAGAGDVTALHKRIEDLQRAVNEHQQGRAGAQRLAAQYEAKMKDLQGELQSANQLLSSLQQELDTTKSAKDETASKLSELEQQAASAMRRATVLQIAAAKYGAIAPLVAEGLVNVQGDSQEEIESSLGTLASRLTDFTNQVGAGNHPAGMATPPPPAGGSTPPVPTDGADPSELKQLVDEKMQIARDLTVPNWKARLAEIDRKIAELEAKKAG